MAPQTVPQLVLARSFGGYATTLSASGAWLLVARSVNENIPRILDRSATGSVRLLPGSGVLKVRSPRMMLS